MRAVVSLIAEGGGREACCCVGALAPRAEQDSSLVLLFEVFASVGAAATFARLSVGGLERRVNSSVPGITFPVVVARF